MSQPPLSKPASTPGNEKALFQAAEKGDTTTVVALLEAGTNANCRNVAQCTPLHEAARNNSVDAAKVLIDRGAQVDARNSDQWTPLHYAAYNNSVDAAKVLIDGGKRLGVPIPIASMEHSQRR